MPMKSDSMENRPGFTLVELLIVVGILAVLIGLLTPAILKNLGVVDDKQHRNERVLLEAALMEYWHDKGHWPLPKKGEDGYLPPDKNSKVVYRFNQSDPKQFDNFYVFNKLLCKSLLNETGGKDYLDPERHTTTREKCGKDDYPNFLPARLIDALEGNNDVKTRRELTLVYWKHLIECPQCPTDDLRRFHGASEDKCRNPSCRFMRDKGYAFTFPPAVKRRTVRGLMPYKVTIDLLNNRATVTDD